VLRFQNLDSFVDDDLQIVKNRGEAMLSASPAPSHSQQSALTDDQILILSTCHMDEVFAESYCNDIINFGRAIEATVLGLHDRCPSHESEQSPAPDSDKPDRSGKYYS